MIACLLRIWEDAVGVITFVCTDFLWVWLLVLARKMLLGAGRVVFIRKLIPFSKNKTATEIISQSPCSQV